MLSILIILMAMLNGSTNHNELMEQMKKRQEILTQLDQKLK
jgi:hypothetical protein